MYYPEPFVSFAYLPPASKDRRDETPAFDDLLTSRQGAKDPAVSVKLCRKSLSHRELGLQGKISGRRREMYNLPFAPTAPLVHDKSKRLVNGKQKLLDCGKSKDAVRTSASRQIIINLARELRLQGFVKGKDYISDARFDFVENELHGCDDFRKSSRALRRITIDLTKGRGFWYKAEEYEVVGGM